VRGVFFKQPFEYRLDVSGDEWRQGDALAAVLTVKNRSNFIQPLPGLFLRLAQGDFKSVREKKPNAFTLIACAELDAQAELGPDEERRFPWTFSLDRNCPVSDKAQSLFLLCGCGELGDAAGHLALNVQPHPHIDAVLSLMESSFSFVLKGQKSRKGRIEAKLKPPAGKEYPTLEHLLLFFRFVEDSLQLNFCFNLKTLQASATTLEMKKAKREIEQVLPLKNYLFPGGQINNEPLEAAIGETLAAVKSKGF